jgi:hypothetical protein
MALTAYLKRTLDHWPALYAALQDAAALDAAGATLLAGSTCIDNFVFAARPDVLNVLASPASGERGQYEHR